MERGRIIVNNIDYTGSFVTPNPSEPPTKDLNTLEIEGEVFYSLISEELSCNKEDILSRRK